MNIVKLILTNVNWLKVRDF